MCTFIIAPAHAHVNNSDKESAYLFAFAEVSEVSVHCDDEILPSASSKDKKNPFYVFIYPVLCDIIRM